MFTCEMGKTPAVAVVGFALLAGCVGQQTRDPNTDPTLIRLKSLEARVQRVESNIGISAPQEPSQSRIVTLGNPQAEAPAQPRPAPQAPVPVAQSQPVALTAEQQRQQRLKSALEEQQAAIARLRDEIARRKLQQQRSPAVPSPRQTQPIPAARPVPAPAPIIQSVPISVPAPKPQLPEPAAATIEMGGERDRYRAAYALLQQGQPEKAQVQFLGFIKSYPNSDYADNAQYWLAESYYGQRDFDNARLEFEKVEQRYPSSSKVSDAQLKIAYIFYEKRQYDEARGLLEAVQNQYTGSRAARLAEDRLLLMKVQGL